MIPEAGSEWRPSDEFDARSIWSMALGFKVDDVFPETPFLSIPSAWQSMEPHPETGTMLAYCWENPAAWEILDTDVDREWFMEQVVTRTGSAPQPAATASGS